MVVGATLVFNGISLISGRPLDAATMGFAGMVIGHYFKGGTASVLDREEPLAEPSLPGADE